MFKKKLEVKADPNKLSMSSTIDLYLKALTIPASDSHKGQNGKLLIIGGSELFHAASKWSLDVASRFVDMVFYSSVAENNELVSQELYREAKGNFWNGIVLPREKIHEYAAEADVILIGPGMERTKETATFTDELVIAYPDKKWVIDAGALQMIHPTLIPRTAILTPHHQEFSRLIERGFDLNSAVKNGVTVVLKGEEDSIFHASFPGDFQMKIEGGNAGMTKGGTGDVLAGLIAGLYATNAAITSAVVGSFINKRAGDSLYEKVGPYFNASDLVQEVPKVLWECVKP